MKIKKVSVLISMGLSMGSMATLHSWVNELKTAGRFGIHRSSSSCRAPSLRACSSRLTLESFVQGLWALSIVYEWRKHFPHVPDLYRYCREEMNKERGVKAHYLMREPDDIFMPPPSTWDDE